MAKGQKRKSKEVRKPKADKKITTQDQPIFAKGSLTPGGATKK
jgi:hypothetical protein